MKSCVSGVGLWNSLNLKAHYRCFCQWALKIIQVFSFIYSFAYHSFLSLKFKCTSMFLRKH
ncbi:hypothetical protein Sjap_010941 [Stephania japonica]|uniref:Uncharacterized protein n=1 Tax=Stephania japonica TaxID=461633 RepID=A0AAP0JAD0_9MAGN